MTWYDTVVATVTVQTAAMYNAMTTYIRNHKAEHITGGNDIIPVATAAKTGLCPVLSDNSGNFLSGKGTWLTPGSTGTVTEVTGTAPIVVATGTTTPAVSISAATTGAAGSMSSAHYTKLEAIEAAADVTDATNVAAAGALMTTATVATTLGTDDTTIPTSKAVKTVTDTLVTKALYDANSVLYATSDNTPVALTVAASTIVGRKSSGDIVALTATEARTILNVADGSNAYVHPNHTGDVTSVADGATTIAAKAVTLAKMNDMATASLLGRSTAGTGAPEVLSKATALSLLNVEDGADVTDATNVNTAGAVMESDYTEYSVLAANTASTPEPITVAASTVLGRKATGGIVAMTMGELAALIYPPEGTTRPLTLDAYNALYAETGSATPGQLDTTLTNAFPVPYAVFQAGAYRTAEKLCWMTHMESNWDASTVTAQMECMIATDETADAIWSLYAVRVPSANTFDVTIPLVATMTVSFGTAYKPYFSAVTSAFSITGTGNTILWMLTRSDAAGDTLTISADFLACKILYGV